YVMWFILTKTYDLPLRIRVDRSAHSSLKRLVGECFEQKQIDVVVAYRKLVTLNAFAFCHHIHQLGPYYKEYLQRLDVNQSERTNIQVRGGHSTKGLH